MTWEHYNLVLRLLSPVRTGLGETGNLQRVRAYVSGRVLWAALTARLTRDLGYGNNGSKYQEIGKTLQAKMRFGYLWPSVDGTSPAYPWETPDFDYLFLRSYVSTAQDYGAGTAEEGSLHETEYIAYRTPDGRQVFLTGHLWVRPDLEQHLPWKDALPHLLLGGERRYGWGRSVPEIPPEPAAYKDIEDPDAFIWNAPFPAHLLPPAQSGVEIAGRLEPLVGWETTPKARKRISDTAVMAYAPGAKIKPKDEKDKGKDEKNRVVRYRIIENGIWQLLEEHNEH